MHIRRGCTLTVALREATRARTDDSSLTLLVACIYSCSPYAASLLAVSPSLTAQKEVKKQGGAARENFWT